MHGAAWRTATVFGVILPTSEAGSKVSVEWEDAVNNLRQVSEHGVQTFILPNETGGCASQPAVCNAAPAATCAPPPQSRALFSNPVSRPRFQPLLPRSILDAGPAASRDVDACSTASTKGARCWRDRIEGRPTLARPHRRTADAGATASKIDCSTLRETSAAPSLTHAKRLTPSSHHRHTLPRT